MGKSLKIILKDLIIYLFSRVLQSFLSSQSRSIRKLHFGFFQWFTWNSGVLHLFRIFAEGEIANSSNNGSSEQPLGILPHQIRGSLGQFSQMTLVGHSSDSCTACCSIVSFTFSNWCKY